MNKPPPKKEEKIESDVEFLKRKLDTFNTSQIITFIDNFNKIDGTYPNISQKEQDKAYDNLFNLFYGKRKRGE